VVAGLVVSGLLFAVYLFVVIAPVAGTFGFDAFAYWSFPRADPYYLAEGHLGSFVYTPVIARLFAPFALLDWYPFIVLWTALLAGTAIWLGGWRRSERRGGETPHGGMRVGGIVGQPLAERAAIAHEPYAADVHTDQRPRGRLELFPRRLGWLAVLAFPPVAVELYHGNIELLIALAIAIGFRYPAAWAFVLVSKVTPGVGLLWFLLRREWRSLAIALGLTAVLVSVSYALDPNLWREWLEREVSVTLQIAPDQPQIAIPLSIRLAAAAVLVAWGAQTDRRWTVVVAGAIAMPVLWVTSFSVLAALGAIDRPELAPRGAANRASVPAPAPERATESAPESAPDTAPEPAT